MVYKYTGSIVTAGWKALGPQKVELLFSLPRGSYVAGLGGLVSTEPVRVTPSPDGTFEVSLLSSEEMRGYPKYKVTALWLSSSGDYSQRDLFEFFAQAGGGLINVAEPRPDWVPPEWFWQPEAPKPWPVDAVWMNSVTDDVKVMQMDGPVFIGNMRGRRGEKGERGLTGVDGVVDPRQAYTLVDGAHRREGNLVKVRGDAQWVDDGITGGVVSGDASIAWAAGDMVYTTELWFKSAVKPSGNASIAQTIGYLGIKSTGELYHSDPAATGSTAVGKNVCDGNWHHLAFSTKRLANSTRVTQGLWIDGVGYVWANQPAALPATSLALNLLGFSGSGADFYGGVTLGQVRISEGPTGRYDGNFTAPGRSLPWDEKTIALTGPEPWAFRRLARAGYPPRPVGAVGGQVTYVGLTAPDDALPRDRWEKR